jgi:hypothetical protein
VSGDTPRMMRMKPLFRPLLDHHDRGISLIQIKKIILKGTKKYTKKKEKETQLVSPLLLSQWFSKWIFPHFH